MKITKPMKVPVLCRPLEDARGARSLHVGAVLAFPLGAPRRLIDEVAFWPAVTAELGQAVFDEGLAKSRSELLLAGSCIAPGADTTSAVHVRARVGRIDRRLSVVGDRYWRNGVPTPPEPFTRMPVDWSRAFGGPSVAENPYGKGTLEVEVHGTRCIPLPNVEPFGALLRAPSDRPMPASFGPMDVTFAQRRAQAGTFGPEFAQRSVARLPSDHDPQFFNLAPLEQRQDGFWSGDEEFLVENMNEATPRQTGKLPGLTARAFVASRRQGDEVFEEVVLRCDTVWLFPTIDVGAVIFRGQAPIVTDDASDIEHLLVACEELGKPRHVEHYRAARARRLDKDKGAIAELSDSDLMPDRESGVAPNPSFGEIGQWVRSERLGAANAERGRQRKLEEARQRIVEAGGDPSILDGHFPPPPTVPEPDDLDAMAAFIEAQQGAMESRLAEAQTVTERIAEASRRAADALETDPMAEIADGGGQVGGPPRFRAADVRRQLEEHASEARTQGSPDTALEAQLLDPNFHERLVAEERSLFDAYRRGAHRMPEAPPMAEGAQQLARLVIQAARDAGESLAERDLTGADLRGLDLRGMDLSRALLECADLRGADLSNANFEGAVLVRADLRGAKLYATRLRRTNLGGAHLESASLDQADLREAILTAAHTEKASFHGASFEGADMVEVRWTGVDLRGANFERCIFTRGDLSEANLAGACLVQATFLECTLDRTNFDGANLHKASLLSCRGAKTSFVGADLREAVIVHESALPEADFEAANLERCCLRCTGLVKASFLHARMTMSDLSECDASHARLERAVLRSALLLRTNLEQASLRGANLTEALLTNARVAGADFTGTQLTRSDFTGAAGDDRTRFSEAVVSWTRFDDKTAKGVRS